MGNLSFSKRLTLYEIDPNLEAQAQIIVENLDSNYYLEGVRNLGDNKMKVWWYNTNLDQLRIEFGTFKINQNLFGRPVKKHKENSKRNRKLKNHKIKYEKHESAPIVKYRDPLNDEFFEQVK